MQSTTTIATPNRMERFHGYHRHPWLKRVFEKITIEEMVLAEHFIQENEALDRDAFALAVNRMFLFKPKPRHWLEISELLTACNSSPAS